MVYTLVVIKFQFRYNRYILQLGPSTYETGSQHRPFDGFFICVIAVIISAQIYFHIFLYIARYTILML